MNDAGAMMHVLDMSKRVEEDESYKTRCIAGEKVFYFEYHKGLAPGHIYTELGIDEFRISQTCEFHFDEWCAEPLDDDESV